MTNEKRAFSNDQFKEFAKAHPEMQLDMYEFQEDEGVFEGTLVLKRWGKSRNVLAYVELDDGHKIMCSAFSNKEYFGIPEMTEGDRIRLTFKKSRTGRINLIDAERM